MEEFNNGDAKYQIKSFLTNGPARFTDIVENLSASKSTISKYLKEFKEINVVTKDEENRYKLLNSLKKEDERILETIIDQGCTTEEEISECLKISVNLSIKLKRLIELGYLDGRPDSLAVTDKALSHLGKKFTGEKLDNQVVGHTTKNGGFESYQVDFDLTMHSPKDFLKFFGESTEDIDICQHCGLPLNPDYIRKIINTDANQDAEVGEKRKEKTEELIRELYGPIGSIYQMYKNYDHEGRGITDKHFISYKKEGKSYHPYCRKMIERL